MRDEVDPEPRTFDGARLRDGRGVAPAYALAATLAGVMAIAAGVDPSLRPALAVVAPLLLVPIGVGLAALRRTATRGGRALGVDAAGLHVDGRLAVPRASIEHADVVRDGDAITVVLRRRGGTACVVEVADVATGDALVRALGLSVDQALSTFNLDAPIPGGSWVAPFAAAVAVGLVPWLLSSAAALLVVPALAALVLAALTPTQLTIGLDGVVLRWLGRRELVRFSELEAVTREGRRLVLRRADGRTHALSARWIAGIGRRGARAGHEGFATSEVYLDAVAQRLREAIAASRAGEPAARAELGRGGREVDAWIASLRGTIARGAAGFRHTETPPDALWRAVEDGAAPAATRAAAAIALGPALDDGGRVRLGRAARLVVTPELRVAIEAVAEGDDTRLVEALAEIEAAAGAEAARRAPSRAR